MSLTNGPTRAGLAALARAIRYIGVVEDPAGSNRGPLIDRWNRAAGVPVGSPYCATFQHAVWNETGVDLGGSFANADSYVPSLYRWGAGLGYERKRPYKTYLVLYDWNRDGVLDHVGIVEQVLALRWLGGRFIGLIRTIEGNTSPGLRGSQSDGGGVYRRTRWVNTGTRFLRIP